jgi:DNA polymerase III epsilon subunit-like protein
MDEDLLRYDKDKEIVFIDCETFNLCLNEFHNLPWQIAMIKYKGNRIVKSWDIYIKWDTELKISKEAAEITKFNRRTYESKAIDSLQAFKTISDQLDNCDYIAGHNLLGFDIYLLKSYYRAMGRDYKHLVDKTIDTNYLARGMKYGIPYKRNEITLAEYQYKILHKIQKGVRTNLKALGKEYNIEYNYDGLHDALVDLELNIKIWDKLKWSVEI